MRDSTPCKKDAMPTEKSDCPTFCGHFFYELVDGQDGNKFYEILLFLAHMNRIEISEFWSMLDDTKKESEKGRTKEEI